MRSKQLSQKHLTKKDFIIRPLTHFACFHFNIIVFGLIRADNKFTNLDFTVPEIQTSMISDTQ